VNATEFHVFTLSLTEWGRHRALLVGGAVFAPGSVVTVNGRPLRTVFLNDTHLLVPNLFGQIRHGFGAAPFHHRGAARPAAFLFILVQGAGGLALIEGL
jgi:hypothetical protein